VNPDLSVVIPAYNEEERLPSTLNRVGRYFDSRNISYEVIVVDDGSTDRTREVAEQAHTAFPQLKAISNGSNRGKGYAVRNGFLHAAGKHVLVSDADLSSPIEEYEKLERGIEGFDGAIGSRAMPESDVFQRQSFFRELSGKFFNIMVRVFMGLRFRDSQCGFKLFERSRFVEVFEKVESNGFAFDVEVLYLAERAGLKVIEVPVRWGNAEGTKVGLGQGLKAFMELNDIRRRHR
jgi:dolichyl-phosphate beta-glucosyltransferase